MAQIRNEVNIGLHSVAYMCTRILRGSRLHQQVKLNMSMGGA